jgi:hypothetical protein
MAGCRTREGGRSTNRLQGIAEASEQVVGSLQSRLGPEEVGLEFGLEVSGAVNWWFFAMAHSPGTIKVTLRWAGNAEKAESATLHEAGPDSEEG